MVARVQMPPIAQGVPKRIVLQYTTGAYAGLHQILGTEDHLREDLKVSDLPTFVDPVSFLDHTGACSLVNVTPRYILYREVIAMRG